MNATPNPQSASPLAPPPGPECPHLLTPATCTYCKRRTPSVRRMAPLTGDARADALYMRQGARAIDRKPTPRSTATPWSGWRSKGPIGTLHYRRMGVHV